MTVVVIVVAVVLGFAEPAEEVVEANVVPGFFVRFSESAKVDFKVEPIIVVDNSAALDDGVENIVVNILEDDKELEVVCGNVVVK